MPQTARTGFMAGPDAGEEAKDACGCRVGEQDGAENLGDADETRRLPGASTDRGGMIYAEPNTLTPVEERCEKSMT